MRKPLTAFCLAAALSGGAHAGTETFFTGWDGMTITEYSSGVLTHVGSFDGGSRSGSGVFGPGSGDVYIGVLGNGSLTLHFTVSQAISDITVSFWSSTNVASGINNRALVDITGPSGYAQSALAAPVGVPIGLNPNPFGSLKWLSFAAAGAAGSYALSFTAPVGSNNSLGYRVDDITVTVTTVPEPATWAMALAGAVALGALARRRGAA